MSYLKNQRPAVTRDRLRQLIDVEKIGWDAVKERFPGYSQSRLSEIYRGKRLPGTSRKTPANV